MNATTLSSAIPSEKHGAHFVRLKLTEAERANPHLRRARERDAVAHGWFASPDEASAFFDSQSDEETTSELRAAFAQSDRLLKQVDAQADRTREAWARQQRLNSLRDRRDRATKALLVEQSKLTFVAELKAQVKTGYGQHIGRSNVSAAELAAIGMHLVGLDTVEAFVRAEVIPQIERDIAAADLALKTFTAAPSPS